MRSTIKGLELGCEDCGLRVNGPVYQKKEGPLAGGLAEAQVKYLGVILDSKRSWIDNVKNKAQTTMASFLISPS